MLQKQSDTTTQLTKQEQSTLLNSLKLTKETKTIVKATFSDKIRDLGEEGWHKVYVVLLKWCKFLGIKEAPDKEEMTLILFFIKQHFAEFTLDEIVNAFNLAVARKLNIDPNHYQNFSSLYVGGILNAYKEHRGKHIVSYRQEVERVEMEAEQEKNKPSAEELEEMRMTALLTIWENFRDGDEEEVEWQVHAYYDILTDAGLITLDKEQKKDILQRAKSICKQEALSQVKNEFTRKRIIKAITEHSSKSPEERVLNKCKLLATQDLFEKLVREELDLGELLDAKEDDRPEITRERGHESSPVEQI